MSFGHALGDKAPLLQTRSLGLTPTIEGHFMRHLLPIIFALIAAVPMPSKGDVVTRIHDIDLGSPGDSALIFLASGQVVSYPRATGVRMEELRLGMLAHRWYRIELNSRHEILSALDIASPLPPLSPTSFQITPPEIYVPSILPDSEVTRQHFSEARRSFTPDSQCYDRAHAWAYDWRRQGIYSSKTWLFFTRRYIRLHNFGWWFHVAPSVHVVIDGKVRERVMDVKYARGPIAVKEWTDIFIRDNTPCPVVERYRDHADFPESGPCFVMKSSMYYYQPVDLELLDLTATPRDRWQPEEVRSAFREAFGETL